MPNLQQRWWALARGHWPALVWGSALGSAGRQALAGAGGRQRCPALGTLGEKVVQHLYEMWVLTYTKRATWSPYFCTWVAVGLLTPHPILGDCKHYV